MQINSIKNFKNNQPHFKMARLTEKGAILAQQTYNQIPEFLDKTISKRNELSKILKSGVQEGSIENFFQGGLSDFAIVNSQFYKKQLSSFSARHNIKKFLKANADNNKTSLVKNLNAIDLELKNQLLDFFDKNIGNENISARQGKKVLSLIEPYMQVDEFAKRNAIVTDKLFSK